MKFYFEKKILVGIIVALMILAWLGYYSWQNNHAFAETSKKVSCTNEILYHLQQAQAQAMDLEAGLLSYTIHGDSTFLPYYYQNKEQARAHFQKLKLLTEGNPAQQKNLENFLTILHRKEKQIEQIVAARKISEQESRALIPSHQNDSLVRELKGALANMQTEELISLGENMMQSEFSLSRFNVLFTTLLVATFFILIFLFVMLNRTLSARIRAEQKTEKVNKELEAFTYSVSHDLRAPLRSIDGYAKMLHEDYGKHMDEEGLRIISVIMNNAKKMGQLIDDLLEFSRMGRKELIKSRLDMKTLVNGVLKENDAFAKAQITIRELYLSKGDQSMVRQVWINLLSNALKYSQKSDTQLIEIGSYKRENEVVYYVKDNGVGFDMQYSGKLFGVFQRLHKAKDFEGTGVGLALVHRIVDKHMGKVWAQAEVNKGATFYFSLPV